MGVRAASIPVAFAGPVLLTVVAVLELACLALVVAGARRDTVGGAPTTPRQAAVRERA